MSKGRLRHRIDLRKRTIYLQGLITPGTAIKVNSALKKLDVGNKKITVYIDSEGGELQSCISIAETIKKCHCTVRTIATGKAFSGAALILASGTKGERYAYENSKGMIHEVQTELGSLSDLKKLIKRLKKMAPNSSELGRRSPEGSFHDDPEMRKHIEVAGRLIREISRQQEAGFSREEILDWAGEQLTLEGLTWSREEGGIMEKPHIVVRFPRTKAMKSGWTFALAPGSSSGKGTPNISCLL